MLLVSWLCTLPRIVQMCFQGTLRQARSKISRRYYNSRFGCVLTRPKPAATKRLHSLEFWDGGPNKYASAAFAGSCVSLCSTSPSKCSAFPVLSLVKGKWGWGSAQRHAEAKTFSDDRFAAQDSALTITAPHTPEALRIFPS